MARVAIAIGSSLGHRVKHAQLAIRKLAHTPGLELIDVSRWVRTPPMAGGEARGWFLNAVACFEASLAPEAILARCVEIEQQAGRRRSRYWGDRTLDLDVLHIDDVVMDSATLRLPHPGITRRSFVLGPLLEIWPEATDPRDGTRYASHAAQTVAPQTAGVLAPRSRLHYLGAHTPHPRRGR